jgi:hypothetical protein
MPLIFAMCDSLEPRLIGVLGLLVALLIVSNLLIACLFVPVMILYSLGAGALTPRSLTCRVAVAFGGLVLGVGVSAIYLLPLLVYRHLFDVSQMQANLPGFELGRYFVFLTSSSFAGPKALEGVLIGSLGFAFLVAGYIWHATGSMKLRAGMAIILGLGTLAAIPDLGPRVIRASGLQVSGFDTPQGFCSLSVWGFSHTAELREWEQIGAILFFSLLLRVHCFSCSHGVLRSGKRFQPSPQFSFLSETVQSFPLLLLALSRLL